MFRKKLLINVFQKKFNSKLNVFDTKAKIKQRNAAALLPDSKKYDYLKEEMAFRISDRIFDVKRCFNVSVDFGCGRGYLRQHLTQDYVGYLYQVDSAVNLLKDMHEEDGEVPFSTIVSDSEVFPFKKDTLDLVVSYLYLHWINDLPGIMKQINYSLKPDGCFMGVMYGGDTLQELRSSLYLADNERQGGFGPHIAPFVDTRDLGGLLNSSGFTLLTIDTDEIVVNYPTMFELMQDLRGMGDSNCAWSRATYLPRDTMFAAAAIYDEMYGLSVDKNPEKFDKLPDECKEQGRVIPATFQFIHFIGWKPHWSQQQPAERGSANVSFKDLDKIVNYQIITDGDDTTIKKVD